VGITLITNTRVNNGWITQLDSYTASSTVNHLDIFLRGNIISTGTENGTTLN